MSVWSHVYFFCGGNNAVLLFICMLNFFQLLPLGILFIGLFALSNVLIIFYFWLLPFFLFFWHHKILQAYIFSVPGLHPAEGIKQSPSSVSIVTLDFAFWNSVHRRKDMKCFCVFEPVVLIPKPGPESSFLYHKSLSLSPLWYVSLSLSSFFSSSFIKIELR